MEQLYSISKVAKMLDVTPLTLVNWHKKGKLVPVLTCGGHRRYKESDLKIFMDIPIKEEPKEE